MEQPPCLHFLATQSGACAIEECDSVAFALRMLEMEAIDDIFELVRCRYHQSARCHLFSMRSFSILYVFEIFTLKPSFTSFGFALNSFLCGQLCGHLSFFVSPSYLISLCLSLFHVISCHLLSVPLSLFISCLLLFPLPLLLLFLLLRRSFTSL